MKTQAGIRQQEAQERRAEELVGFQRAEAERQQQKFPLELQQMQAQNDQIRANIRVMGAQEVPLKAQAAAAQSTIRDHDALVKNLGTEGAIKAAQLEQLRQTNRFLNAPLDLATASAPVRALYGPEMETFLHTFTRPEDLTLGNLGHLLPIVRQTHPEELNQAEILAMQRQREALPPDDPKRAQLDDAIRSRAQLFGTLPRVPSEDAIKTEISRANQVMLDPRAHPLEKARANQAMHSYKDTLASLTGNPAVAATLSPLEEAFIPWPNLRSRRAIRNAP